MSRIIAVLIIILSISGLENTAESGTKKRELSGQASEVNITSVDARWLQKALLYDYKSDARPLVKEFAQAHPSEALPRDTKLDSEAYLNIMTVYLDEIPEPEHLLFIGQDQAHTMLYVIARRGEQWTIIFEEYVDMFNEEPELYIINQDSRNKLFYIRMLQERGSGVWLLTYRFYKMVGGTVYDVLDIVQQSNLMLEPSDLYEHVDAIVRGDSDGIFVTYKYGLPRACGCS